MMMSSENIIIWTSLFLILFLVISCLIVFLIYLNREYNKNLCQSGLFSLIVDLEKSRIKREHFLWSDKIFNSEIEQTITKYFGKGWVDISTIMNNFTEKQRTTWQEAINFCAQNKENISINWNINLNNKSTEISSWNVEFYYIKDNEIKVNIKWINVEKINSKPKIWTKQDLLNDQDEYKLFVAFNLISNEKETIKEFINYFGISINIKNSHYLISKNTAILILKNKSFKKVQKLKTKLNKRLKTKLNKHKYIENYYDAITFVEGRNINLNEDFIEIMTRISFGIVKSRLMKEPFYFNLKSIFFNEFEEFKESLIAINSIIENQKIGTKIIRVNNIKNKNKSFEYLLPEYIIEDNNWTRNILKYSHYSEIIDDLFFDQVLQAPPDKTFMIKMNDYHIKKRFSQMVKNNNIIYIINLVKLKKVQDLITLFDIMKRYEIKFGIRIKEFNSTIASIIKNVKPNIVIVASDFEEKSENDLISNLSRISLILICEKLKTIPIFEGGLKFKNQLKLIGHSDIYYF